MHWQLLALAKRVLKPQDKNLLGKKNATWSQKVFKSWQTFFPKDSYLGALRLFLRVQAAASASPPQFSSPAGQCRVNLDRPGSSGRTRFWPSCSALRQISRNSLAATPSRSDFIYTEMVARRRFEFYLHRDGCAAAIRVLSTQRLVRRGDLILIDLYLHRDGCAAQN